MGRKPCKHLKQQEVPNTMLQPFACGLCEDKFCNIAKLYDHFEDHKKCNGNDIHNCLSKSPEKISSSVQCFSCKQTFPSVNHLHDHYKSQPGIVSYTINIHEKTGVPQPDCQCSVNPFSVEKSQLVKAPTGRKRKPETLRSVASFEQVEEQNTVSKFPRGRKDYVDTSIGRKSHKSLTKKDPVVFIDRILDKERHGTNEKKSSTDTHFDKPSTHSDKLRKNKPKKGWVYVSEEETDNDVDETIPDLFDEAIDECSDHDDLDNDFENQILKEGENTKDKVNNVCNEDPTSETKDWIMVKTEVNNDSEVFSDNLEPTVKGPVNTIAEVENSKAIADKLHENVKEEDTRKQVVKSKYKRRRKTGKRKYVKPKPEGTPKRKYWRHEMEIENQVLSEDSDETEECVVRGLRSGKKVLKKEVIIDEKEIEKEVVESSEDQDEATDNGENAPVKKSKEKKAKSRWSRPKKKDIGWSPGGSAKPTTTEFRWRYCFVKERKICEICGILINLYRYKQHLEMHETEKGKQRFSEDNLMFCVKCGTKMRKPNRSLDMRREHRCDPIGVKMIYEREGKMFPLPEINAIKKEKRRKKARGKKRSIICHLCGKLVSKGFMKKHLMVTHSEARPFSCEICCRKFKLLSLLNQHRRLVHERRQAAELCAVCGLRLRSKGQLTVHLRLVHGDGPQHQCGTCKKRFGTMKHLKGHEKIHLVPTLQCPQCPRMLRTQTMLNYHVKKDHTEKVREWMCLWPDCKQTFYLSKTLKNHMLRHTGEKIHSCRLCTSGYVQKHELKFHLKRSHNVHECSSEVCKSTKCKTVSKVNYFLPAVPGESFRMRTIAFHRKLMETMNIPVPEFPQQSSDSEDENEAAIVPTSVINAQRRIEVKRNESGRQLDTNLTSKFSDTLVQSTNTAWAVVGFSAVVPGPSVRMPNEPFAGFDSLIEPGSNIETQNTSLGNETSNDPIKYYGTPATFRTYSDDNSSM